MCNNIYDVTEVLEIINSIENLNKYDSRRVNLRKNIELEEKKINSSDKESYTKEEILHILQNIL
ncbi:hypothetical protein EXM90_11500 [Clostridium botulinum]|uniref:hypothetical protein n=1 Tax=Clostridium botulinum TaxID=1491 RepID=UPI0007743998|nr:hypothetical protein [Clostridium botulinum]AUN01424.1 hypothetical protein RSJ19_00135 [Clostridium botulinum]MBN3367229.1 hypothetical protein [Clostridium botulinum]MBN3371613.1 hypothetical protein [Clostridium botulinum]MBN3376435.1 hypothetical protein [Clostridium botulinum]MBN3384238.1 hypothetical protein [Clostridium botulinum]